MTMKPTEKKLRLSLITIAALLGYFSIELIFPRTTREIFLFGIVGMILSLGNRSEERRVGKECRL